MPGIHQLCLCKAYLSQRILHVLNHFLLSIDSKITFFPVNINLDIICPAEVVLASCEKGIFDGLEKHLLADIIFLFQHV